MQVSQQYLGIVCLGMLKRTPEQEDLLQGKQPYFLQVYSIKGEHSCRQSLEETLVGEINEINQSIPLIGI